MKSIEFNQNGLKHRLFNCNCTELLRDLDEQTVDLVVTSPPYDNLRAYETDESGAITWGETIWKYTIFRLYQLLKDGGIVVWVVNDATVDGSETGTSFKQCLYAKECGFRIHDTMIFAKNNPIPQNHNRYEQCFEYMFVWSKGRPKTFNPLRVPTVHGGEVMNWGGRKTEMDDNQCRRHRTDCLITTKQDKPRNNIFYYTVGGGDSGHPAVFPYQLAQDHILSWSNEGDTVLDPFSGSGTTAIACINNRRQFIGSELNPTYYENSVKRINEELNGRLF